MAANEKLENVFKSDILIGLERKKRVFLVLTYGAEILTLTRNFIIKFQVAQRAMERFMKNLTIRNINHIFKERTGLNNYKLEKNWPNCQLLR